MKKPATRRTPRVWVFVVDSRNQQDLRDLDHLDGILWGSNPNAQRGDIVLMYRTAPYSDLAYAFIAASDPRPTRRQDMVDTEWVIELTDKARIDKPLTLDTLKTQRALSHWSFLAYQQGVMRRRRDVTEEGAWPPLRRLLTRRGPAMVRLLKKIGGSASNPQEMRRVSRGPRSSALQVFLSYGSEDRKRVRRLYTKLNREPDLRPWFDRTRLDAGDAWEEAIDAAIQKSDVVVICLSSRSVKRIGFFQSEIGRILSIADQQPEGTTFVVPAKLAACETPHRLSKWQYVDLFRRGGYQKLVAGLRKRAEFLAEAALTTTERATATETA